MADLSSKKSAQSVKLAGANPTTGDESNFVNVDGNGNLATNDIINTQGLQGTLAIAANTPRVVRVGGTNLANRKSVTLDNTGNATVYWGYSATTSLTDFAGRIFKDQQGSWNVGPNVDIYLFCPTATSVKITEGA